ncbi:solute carrier family 35 member F2 isoform X2 [Eutrema salsugineum]|uniref:solute carrier family 35 member F2 isoform X2 n=1 Tax=Eutrema salsugineum TaxID=72664 RepID=UPI000CECF44D|nr:solute carrier family 35 member F2 isoform X2 [Eutrema salsugineum]
MNFTSINHSGAWKCDLGFHFPSLSRLSILISWKERAIVMGFNFKENKTKKTLIGLGLGQILSLLCTCNAFTSSELARKGINAPTTQSFLSYMLLAIVYGGIMLYRRPTIKAKWYHYFLLALVDVEGNFLVVKANQYTSITSVMLLDCWAIPCVLVLTWLFLKTKYRLMKISGVVICIVGVVMVVFSDVHAGSQAGGSNPVKGDFLVIAGATLYAVSNTSEEFLVKNANTVELMTFMGFFGAIISAIQIGILERGELRSIHWSADVVIFLLCPFHFHFQSLQTKEFSFMALTLSWYQVFPFLRVAVTMFFFYSLLPVLLKTNGSTTFTLSLLTSDMWAVSIRIFAYHEKVDWLYYLAFATTAIGLIIYSMKEKDEEEQRDEQRKLLLDEEDGETFRVSLI